MRKTFFIIALFSLFFVSPMMLSQAYAAPVAPIGPVGPGQNPPAQNSTGGITNKAIVPSLGGSPTDSNNGTIFTHYFIVLWQGIIVIGTLAMLFNLVNGALEWITAGGEAEKVKHGRMKMTEGVVGLIILVGSYASIMFIGKVFQFDVLNITLPTP